MRLVLPAILALCGSAAFSQVFIDPGRLSNVVKNFDSKKSDPELACSVDPITPRLNFSLRFQAGYVARVSAGQFSDSGHHLRAVLRVTPENNPQPVYLANFTRLPNIPRTSRKLELSGLYLVGEGRYAVDWMLMDDSGRICRKRWRVEARLGSDERGLKPSIPAGTVAEASFHRWSREQAGGGEAPLRRITILLHAAPLAPNTNRLRPQDRIMLLGSLASMLESLPARSVRLVVFNLDQQKELFRDDELTPESFPQVAQALNELQLQLVDYRTLENQRGHIDLVAALVSQEIHSESASDAVFFLGPPSRYGDKLPQAALGEQGTASPQFFYFRYTPYWRRAAELPDSIALAVKKLKGKTIPIRTPGDFAKAIQQAGTQLLADR